MEELMFTSPIHQDLGSSAMFRMYPTMTPGMGMYGAGMYYGANVQGPGLTKDKFQLVDSKRKEGRNFIKKAVLAVGATVLSIAILHKLPLKKCAKAINTASTTVWNGVKSVCKFVGGWIKWAGNKVANLCKKIPSAPTP